MGELIGGAYKSDYSGDYIDDALNKSACFKRGVSGTNSVVVGNTSSNSASGNYSLAQGNGTTASNRSAHAEGAGTAASGPDSHAEGNGCYADGSASHAEGLQTTAAGSYAHSEGDNTYAQGNASHAEGYGTRTDGRAQHVFGEYNEYDENETDRKTQRGDFVEMVGCGSSSLNRSNARTLDWDGNEKLKGGLYIDMDTSTADLDNAKRVIAAGNIARAFYETSWSVGDYCIRNGTLYLCIIPHAGAWDASHFTAVSVGDELNNRMIEDTDNPGCFFRWVTVNGTAVKEWWNPPLADGTEYRTTERFEGDVVYQQLVNLGSAGSAGTQTLNHGISNIGNTISCLGYLTSISNPPKKFVAPRDNYWETPLPIEALHFGKFTATSVDVLVGSKWASRDLMALLKYTKS